MLPDRDLLAAIYIISRHSQDLSSVSIGMAYVRADQVRAAISEHNEIETNSRRTIPGEME